MFCKIKFKKIFICDLQIFPANYDSFNPQSNFFDTPIRTRFLRLYPVRWNNYPALRIEILGCFEPYGKDE